MTDDDTSDIGQQFSTGRTEPSAHGKIQGGGRAMVITKISTHINLHTKNYILTPEITYKSKTSLLSHILAPPMRELPQTY
jgi:hypothetical protein